MSFQSTAHYLFPNARFNRSAIFAEIACRVSCSAANARRNGWSVTASDMNRYRRFHAMQVWGEAKHERGLLINRLATQTPEEHAEIMALLDVARFHDPIRDYAVVSAAQLRLAELRAAARSRAYAALFTR